MVRLVYVIVISPIFFLYPLQGWSQTSDFFSNTQSTSKLATGPSPCPSDATCTANSPGFNPSALILHSGTDPDLLAGPISFSLNVNGVDVTGTEIAPHFSRLGPGAITDNMFGMISAASDPVRCGQDDGNGIRPDEVDAGGNSLNCGDLRFDPASQGMTIPAFPAANILESVIFSPATFLGDSNTPNLNFGTTSDLHASLDLKNRFIWNNTTTSITDVDLTVACTAGTVACVGSKQREKEVIAVSGTAFGTLADPGPVGAGIGGEQVFDQTSEWQITGSTATFFIPPTINWTQRIQNPVFGDNIDGVIDLNFANREFDTSTISGSFTYNAGTFPTTTLPMMSSSSAASPCTGAPVGNCTTIP